MCALHCRIDRIKVDGGIMYNELKLTLDFGKIGEYKMISHDDGRMVSAYNVGYDVGYESGYRTAKEQCKNKNEKVLLIVLIFVVLMVNIVYSFV